MIKNKQSEQASLVQEQIVQLFVGLFRLQLGVPKDHPAELDCVSEDPISRSKIYEMTVEWEGKPNRKRMTIAALGENSGGRSLCFKVIYDDILVIKVPANPIRQFNSYVASVAAEKRITTKVGRSLPCIIPSVAAMCRRIPAFPSSQIDDPDRLERASIQWLETYVVYQEFVRLEDTFIYVMELSESQFLSQVLTDIHDVTKLIETEANQQMGLTMDFADFEHRYGPVDVSVWLGINTLYAEFERLVERQKRKKPEAGDRLVGYRVRESFGRWLSQIGQKQVSMDTADPTLAELTPIFECLQKEFPQEIADYHETIRRRMRKRAFDRNRYRMGTVIEQLLDLLARLDQIPLAVRDLKPDNVFMAQRKATDAQPNGNDQALDGQIGLIDMETAVLLPDDPQRSCPQPLLGGTPPYATPLNFVKNKMLVHFYRDVSEILKLQDWYAIVAMIYSVVVGKMLFRNAGRSIVSIVDTFQRHDLGRRTFGQALKKGSRIFWSVAADDFMKALSAHAERLKQVYVTIPAPACYMMQVRIRREHKLREKNYRALCARAADSGHTAQYDDTLKKLKGQVRQQVRLYDFFDQEGPQMTAYHLMHFMFNIVFRNMYLTEWGRLIDKPVAKFEKSVRKATLDVTSLLPS